MYKCLDCGHIFDEGGEKNYTETHGERFAPSERWKGCPVCGGAFEQTIRCEECGAEHLADELYADKWCAGCLTEKVTYDSFLEWMMASENSPIRVGVIEHFMFTTVFELREECVPSISSAKFKNFLREWYLRMVANDKLIGYGDFLETIRAYALESESDKQDFAEWLTKEEKDD